MEKGNGFMVKNAQWTVLLVVLAFCGAAPCLPDCNLYNSAGLPASPFRTDTWPGITEGIVKPSN